MITIKKKHNLNDPLFIELLNKFNNVVRYSYNRIIKNNLTKLSDLEKNVKQNMKNIDCLDSSWIKTAVKKSTELNKDKKIYFGGKSNFFKRKFKKINRYSKNFPLEMRGSSSDKGNRKATLNGNQFILKPSKGIKWILNLNLSKNESKLLNIIQSECLTGKNYFNFKIDVDYIYISFNEPTIIQHKYTKDRYLGIDLNPNYIALSILDKGTKEIFKQIIDIKQLNKSNKFKKKHELVEVNKHIIKICQTYQVEFVALEDLSIKSSNKGLGKRFNKLVNNDWLRNYLINNLTKQMNINGIKSLKVNPYYTSFIGQIKNSTDYDSVAASKEVAFRAYLIIKGIKVNDYVSDFLSSLVDTHWKEILPEINTFKDLYNHFKSSKKKPKSSYRFLFNDKEKLSRSFFRLKSYKSLIDLIKL